MSALRSCSWRGVDEGWCTLDDVTHPWSGGTPVLECTPKYDLHSANQCTCRVAP